MLCRILPFYPRRVTAQLYYYCGLTKQLWRHSVSHCLSFQGLLFKSKKEMVSVNVAIIYVQYSTTPFSEAACTHHTGVGTGAVTDLTRMATRHGTEFGLKKPWTLEFGFVCNFK